MKLTDYNKLWGALAGGVVGLLVAYNVVPQGTGDTVLQLVNLAIPLVTSAVATFAFPKNTN